MMHRLSRNFLLLVVVITINACSTAREQVASPESPPFEKAEDVSEEDQLKSTAMLIEGIQQKLLGNTERALILFFDAANKDPNNDAAQYELAKIHAMKGEYEDALRYANTAIGIDPDNTRYHMLLADIYILTDNLPEAVKVYEQIARDNPDNVQHQRNLVSAYLHNEQYEEAFAVLDHIETLVGVSQEVSIQKHKILMRLEEYDKAIEEAKKMKSYFPEELVFYEVLGELYMETGQKEKAREVYLEMLEHDPDSFMARLLLADYYHQKDQPDKAFEHIKEAFHSPGLDIDGKGRILYSYLRRSEEEPAFLEQALTLAEIVLETHPEDPESYLIYGDLLNQRGKKEEARDMYLMGVRLDPSSLQVWQQILTLDLQLGDYENMLEHSDMALGYFFEQPILFLFNGLANMQLKDYEAAASALEYGLSMAVADEELQQDFLAMLGDTYYYLDAHDESDRYYEKALAINPENATALNNYSYHLALRKERLDKALEMSERSLQLDPDNAAFLDTYGWIKYQKKEYKEAQRWIAKALEASDDPGAAILEHYGDVLYQLGQKDNAVQYWKKAKEKGDGSDLLYKKIRDRTLYE